MPTPREAMDVLGRFLTPNRWGMQVGGGNAADVLELAGHRDDLRDELSARVAGDLSVGDARQARGDQYRLEDLDDEIADDPYIGDMERARVEKTRRTLDAANTSLRTEVDDAARAQANRNAFGTFLGKRAGYEAEISPEGTEALDAASRRKVNEASAAAGDRLYEKMLLQQTKPNELSAGGKSSMTALNDMEFMAPSLLQRLREKYPGIDTDPDKYGGAGALAQEKWNKFLYNMGLYKRDEDIGQLENLFRVIAARPYMQGRPNQKVYTDIMSHLGEYGFSPAADYKRIEQIFKLVPEMKEAIESAEAPRNDLPGSLGLPGGGGQVQPGRPAPGRPALAGAGPWILRDGKLVSKDSVAPPNVTVRRLPD